MASLFFRGNNSENSGAAICHPVYRDNYYHAIVMAGLVPAIHAFASHHSAAP
jgi:hypothetical protein